MNKSAENTTQPKRVGCQEAKELKEREKTGLFSPENWQYFKPGLERKGRMRISGRGQGIHEGPEQGEKGWLLKNKLVNIQMFSYKDTVPCIQDIHKILVNELQYIHTMRYYAAIRLNEAALHVIYVIY